MYADALFLDRGNAMLSDESAPDWAHPSPPREGCRVTPLIEAPTCSRRWSGW
jgi:hypothetical protein